MPEDLCTKWQQNGSKCCAIRRAITVTQLEHSVDIESNTVSIYIQPAAAFSTTSRYVNRRPLSDHPETHTEELQDC